jgi:hypothetical protein
MACRHFARTALSCTVALGLYMAAAAAAPAQEAGSSPLALGASRESIAGTSNIHACTASTTGLRVTRVRLASSVAGPNFWEEIVKPGALEAFEIAIPAATLVSDKEGLDRNMHKAQVRTASEADIRRASVPVEAPADPRCKDDDRAAASGDSRAPRSTLQSPRNCL